MKQYLPLAESEKLSCYKMPLFYLFVLHQACHISYSSERIFDARGMNQEADFEADQACIVD